MFGLFYKGDNRNDLYPDEVVPTHGRLLHTVKMMPFEDKSVFVIGDSYGWYAKYALEHGAKLVHSFDIAPPSTHIAGLLNIYPNFKHEVLSVFDLNVHNQYDIAGYFEVIEHLPPGTELESIKRISNSLKKGGVLLLSTPYRSLLSYLVDPVWIFGHRHYSLTGIKTLFIEAGLEVKNIYRGGYIYAALDIFLMYFTKWVLRKKYDSRIQAKSDTEYPHTHGIMLFAVGMKKS